MTNKKFETEILYEKIGRRYVPKWDVWNDPKDLMKPGQFRLTYAYGDGGYRYEYDVTPSTAAWVAASMLAQHAIEEAIREAAPAKPSEPRVYTKKQQEIIKRYRAEMAAAGGNLPEWWAITSPRDIAKAAIEAVKNWRP